MRFSTVHSTRVGVTMANVLVAILVIGLAVATMISWFGSSGVRSGDSSSTNICQNNMRNIALALVYFDSAKGAYPAINRKITVEGQEYNRPLMYFLLPFLERNDIYAQYLDQGIEIRSGDGSHYVKALVCPSDMEPRGMPSSYVFNCGLPNTPGSNLREATEGMSDANAKNNGVFFSLHSNGLNNSAYITANDGMRTTLLISENVAAGAWNDGTEISNGFTWHDLADVSNVQINANLGKAPGGKATDTDWARPASNHRGGVNVAFADAHVTFLNENIDYVTYAQLMTTAGRLAGTIDMSTDASARANDDSEPKIVPPVHVPVHTESLKYKED